MRPLLYLDTARIGLLTTEAKQACKDALALAIHDPATAFREFSKDGNSDIIRHWRGVAGLREDLLRMVGAYPHNRLMLASSSGTLVSLASRCLFKLARKPLITDLAWPNHVDQLQLESSATNNQLVLARIRSAILGGSSPADIVHAIASSYDANHCDAIYLTAVSSDGLRLPVRRILAACKRLRTPRLAVVDGAQEFAHYDECSVDSDVDFYLFGSHKWLGAYHPLNVATFGCERSVEFIEKTAETMIRSREIIDTTFRFSNDAGRANYETINMLPYFSLAGALVTATKRVFSFSANNADSFCEIAGKCGWRNRYEQVKPDFTKSIAVIERPSSRKFKPARLETHFLKNGLTVTALPDSAIRVSLPRKRFNSTELSMIESSMLSA